jgi:preprotein translocase subunit SecG
MLYYVLVTVYLLICLFLLIVVLLQQGKGGDMASAFGGGGSSQTAFGARSGATVLTRATTILGALFMLGAIILGVFGQRGPGSVMSGARTAPTQAPAPQTPGK